MRSFFVLLAVWLVTGAATAWNEEGHRAVALVAQGRLSPQARAWTESLLQHHPHQICSMADASCWADDVRPLPEYHRGSWHYVNQPVFLGVPERPIPIRGDLLRAINLNTRIVKDPALAPSERAIALSWLIHLIGDIHQPLHAANGYSSGFPQGDRGGGRFKVRLGQEDTDLHTFWDSAGGLFWKGANRQRLPELVGSWPASYPPGENSAIRAPRAWAEESRTLAAATVYPGVTERAALAPDYIATARHVSQRRITLAGYRLASYIERLHSACKG
jgi:hypothetical protein